MRDIFNKKNTIFYFICTKYQNIKKKTQMFYNKSSSTTTTTTGIIIIIKTESLIKLFY